MVGLLHQTVAQTSIPYDCRLYSGATQCSGGGTCDTASGVCTCTTAGTQYNCENQVAAGLTGCDAAANCDATGTYVCTGTPATTCSCKAGYTTDTAVATPGCAVPRIHATCKSAGVDIRVYPYLGSAFGGEIRFMDQPGTGHTTTCAALAQDGTNNDLYMYADYPYTASPGQDCPIPQDTAGSEPYTLYLYLQYQPSIYSSTDLKITITCQLPTLPATETTAAITVVHAEPTAVDSTQTFDVSSGVTMNLYDTGTTDAIASPVAHGQLIDLVFTVNVPATGGLFDNYAVVKVEVSNNPFLVTPPSGHASVVLIDEACVMETSTNLVTAVTKARDTTTTDLGLITVTFRGFNFRTQAVGYTTAESVVVGTTYLQAVVAIGLYVRTGGEADCTALATGSDNAAYADMIAAFAGRRKKRSTDAGYKDVYLNVSMVVAPPYATSTTPGANLTNDEAHSCYNSAAFIVPVVLMGLLMFVAMAMAFFFCTRLTRYHGNQMDGTTNMAYKS